MTVQKASSGDHASGHRRADGADGADDATFTIGPGGFAGAGRYTRNGRSRGARPFSAVAGGFGGVGFLMDVGRFGVTGSLDDPPDPDEPLSVLETQLQLQFAIIEGTPLPSQVPAPMLADAAGAAFAGLFGSPPEAMGYEQATTLLVSAGRLASAAEALKARAVARICQTSIGEVPHASPSSPSRKAEALAKVVSQTEVATALTLSETAAQKLMIDSVDLVEEFPATLDALESGSVNAQQAGVIIDQARSIEADTVQGRTARAKFEATLLDEAPGRPRPQMSARARRLRERLHPETITRRKEKAACDRRVEFEARDDGMAYLGAFIPAEAATAAFNRMTTAARSLQGPDEPRTLTQLRADVFADLMISAGAVPPETHRAPRPATSSGTHPVTGSDAGADEANTAAGTAPRTAKRPAPDYDRIRAEVLVTVPVLTLLGVSDEPADLEGYGPMDADTARRLAGRASSFKRILTHPETGAILSYGRSTYQVPVELKRMVRHRDRSCRAPGCNRTARFCETDHTIPWAHGGGTDYGNLKTLCKKHHALKSAGLWKDTQHADGAVTWTSPAGRTHTTNPERQYFDPWDPKTLHRPSEPTDNDDPPPF